eukprot:GHVN01003962.1.p2 GENE.GHVN01003962.1~~GHVN01003962.1.p2  ORF type:complete len:544 (-),score=33.25 GHVN01003962.1:2265-3704(-)
MAPHFWIEPLHLLADLAPKLRNEVVCPMWTDAFGTYSSVPLFSDVSCVEGVGSEVILTHRWRSYRSNGLWMVYAPRAGGRGESIHIRQNAIRPFTSAVYHNLSEAVVLPGSDHITSLESTAWGRGLSAVPHPAEAACVVDNQMQWTWESDIDINSLLPDEAFARKETVAFMVGRLYPSRMTGSFEQHISRDASEGCRYMSAHDGSGYIHAPVGGYKTAADHFRDSKMRVLEYGGQVLKPKLAAISPDHLVELHNGLVKEGYVSTDQRGNYAMLDPETIVADEVLRIRKGEEPVVPRGSYELNPAGQPVPTSQVLDALKLLSEAYQAMRMERECVEHAQSMVGTRHRQEELPDDRLTSRDMDTMGGVARSSRRQDDTMVYLNEGSVQRQADYEKRPATYKPAGAVQNVQAGALGGQARPQQSRGGGGQPQIVGGSRSMAQPVPPPHIPHRDTASDAGHSNVADDGLGVNPSPPNSGGGDQ